MERVGGSARLYDMVIASDGREREGKMKRRKRSKRELEKMKEGREKGERGKKEEEGREREREGWPNKALVCSNLIWGNAFPLIGQLEQRGRELMR